MKKEEWKRMVLLFGIILLAALIKDMTESKIDVEGKIYREDAGGLEQEMDLVAEVEGEESVYTYRIIVEPVAVTQQEAEGHIAKAKEIIETDFSKWESILPIAESYVSEMVEAEWTFSPGEYVKRDGSIIFENIPEEGVLVQVNVLLTCGAYEEVYTFPIWLDDGQIPQEKKTNIALEKELKNLLEQKESKRLELPTHINGTMVKWSEKKEFLFFKVMFLELIAAGLIYIGLYQKKKREKEKRNTEIELSYADIVSQLAILLRAGMTTRQAWNSIAVKQKDKRTSISEYIVRLNMRLKEGEKERVVYEMFAQETDVISYRRLMRILIANLEKGTSDICFYLEEESRKAYEERIALAKKKGEEASTKLLLPLMIMMVLVMAIVLIPAMVSFSV